MNIEIKLTDSMLLKWLDKAYMESDLSDPAIKSALPIVLSFKGCSINLEELATLEYDYMEERANIYMPVEAQSKEYVNDNGFSGDECWGGNASVKLTDEDQRLIKLISEAYYNGISYHNKIERLKEEQANAKPAKDKAE